MALGGSGGPCSPKRSGLLIKESDVEDTADDVLALCLLLSPEDLALRALVIDVRRGKELLSNPGPLLRRELPLICRGVL